MKKTLKVGYGQKAEKVTIESTCKKLYGTAVWKELGKAVLQMESIHCSVL